jgi:hypothetical protein
MGIERNAAEPSVSNTKHHRMRRYFLVTSSGASAAGWLAASLNQHPDICCSCGSAPVSNSIHYHHVSTPEFLERHAAFLTAHCVGPQATPRSIDQMFQELEGFRSVGFYGNVHAETVLTYHASLRTCPPLRRFTVANLVRHAIPRAEARYRSIHQDSEASPGMAKVCDFQFRDRVNRLPSVADAILEQIGDIESDPKKRRFTSAILETIGASTEFVNEAAQAPMDHYRIEDLKGNREHYQGFVRKMTNGNLDPAPQYLDAIFSEENLNSGRCRNDSLAKVPPPSPEAQWRAWSEWQRRAFQAAMVSSRFHEQFETVGYSFAFVGAPSAPLFPGWRRYSASPPPKVAAPALFNQMP